MHEQHRFGQDVEHQLTDTRMKAPRYLEDLAVGQTFRSASVRIEEDDIRQFATAFDPQPFHLDNEAALATIFRGLAASGWHTAALTMRLLVEGEFNPAGGIVGASIEEIRWPRPVRPGDELRVEAEIMEVRPSKTKPQQGVAKVSVITLNQDNEAVQTYVGNLIVMRRLG
ncbi:MAG: MaoC family dehydratase [Rhodocyclaceae bacterium]|nr:MaoC family dehydratase [Rhodocyclaceae bacterium]